MPNLRLRQSTVRHRNRTGFQWTSISWCCTPWCATEKAGFASDLREQDFEVYEDGVRQPIRVFRHEDIPVTVGLVVDHSGSMRRKLTDVIAAARTFARSSNQEDQMFVVNFNEHVSLMGPPGRFTNRSEELELAISSSPTIGMTALYDAVVKARERLQAGTRDKKVLIVISDGGDNASAHSLADVLKGAEQSSALVYTIGIFDEADPDRNPKRAPPPRWGDWRRSLLPPPTQRGGIDLPNASRATFAINTPSDMFPATRRSPAPIGPFEWLPGRPGGRNCSCAPARLRCRW